MLDGAGACSGSLCLLSPQFRDSHDRMPSTTPISLPGVTTPTRVVFHGVRWLLERRARGVFCVAMDETGLLHEGFIGLPDGQSVEARVELRAPDHPVEVSLACDIVLTPSSSLSGWLPVPMQQRLLVTSTFGDAPVVTLSHPDLRMAWREGEGYHHAQEETFRADVEPLSRDRHRMWMQLELENHSAELVRPKRLPLAIQACDIVSEGGFAFGPKIRWTFGETSTVQLEAPSTHLLSPDFKRTSEPA